MTWTQCLDAVAGYKVYASEGAHSSFAPRGDLQRQIQAYVEEKFGYCEGALSEITLVSTEAGPHFAVQLPSMLSLIGQNVAVSGHAQHFDFHSCMFHSFVPPLICSSIHSSTHSVIDHMISFGVRCWEYTACHCKQCCSSICAFQHIVHCNI